MRRTAEDDTAVAAMLERVAVLLSAGISPLRVWEHLAAVGDDSAVLVLAEVRRGRTIADAIAGQGARWVDAAVAWRVATTVGAPLGESLRAIARALHDIQRTRDDIRAALAEPTATARLIAWLPLVAVALSIALGFDMWAVVTSALGLIAMSLGAALMLLSRWWTKRLVAAAAPEAEVAGFHADLTAVALGGGVSIARALAVVADSGGGGMTSASRAVLELSRRTGAPAIDLLRGGAALARQQSRTEGRLRAAALSTRLLLPMGVCTLPAFLLLGVVPMLLSVLAPTGPLL